MCLNTHSTKLIHLCLPMWLCRSDEPSGRSLLCLDSGDVLGTCPRWWWGMWTQARLVGVDPLLQASAQQADSVHLLRSLTDARYTMTEWCCGLGTRQFCVTQGCHFFSGKSGNLGQVGGVLRWLERSVSRESRKGLSCGNWYFPSSYWCSCFDSSGRVTVTSTIFLLWSLCFVSCVLKLKIFWEIFLYEKWQPWSLGVLTKNCSACHVGGSDWLFCSVRCTVLFCSVFSIHRLCVFSRAS